MMKLLRAGIVAILALGYSTAAMAECSSTAGPEIDWSGCDKRRASLTGADLTNTDLTGADLTGAKLTGADLTKADLSRATWTDGRTCAEGSIETCK